MHFLEKLSILSPFSQRAIYVRSLRCVAAALFVVYLAWNAYWLSQASIPPSLFKSLTGLPCPTTGGTRSLLEFCRGEFAESMRYNPMTLPIAGLFCLSAIWPIALWVRRKRPVIPLWIALGWFVALSIAWVAKLLGDPQYW